MNQQTPLDISGAYVLAQSQDRRKHFSPTRRCRAQPAITISHLTGAGAPEIAGQLAQLLSKIKFAGDRPWAVFNHQIIEHALEDKRWPKQLAEKITEDKRLFLEELIDDVLDLQPPSWVLVPQVVKTTLRLAMAGHAILVGHGATVITAKLTDVFHVRLTGSLASRIERVRQLKKLTPEAAAAFVRREDRRRKKFLRANFHTHLDNELLYDLTISTDRISNDDAAALIFEGAQRFFSSR